MLQQSGHHICTKSSIEKLEAIQIARGVQLDLLSQTMNTQAVFLVFSINSTGPA